jgi:hypothetical protein
MSVRQSDFRVSMKAHIARRGRGEVALVRI